MWWFEYNWLPVSLPIEPPKSTDAGVPPKLTRLKGKNPRVITGFQVYVPLNRSEFVGLASSRPNAYSNL